MDLIAHTSLSPIRRGFAPGFVNYKKGCTRLAATSDKVYQLLAHGRWFFPGTPASSTTKTGHHDIAENGVKHQKSINQSIKIRSFTCSPLLICEAWEIWGDSITGHMWMTLCQEYTQRYDKYDYDLLQPIRLLVACQAV